MSAPADARTRPAMASLDFGRAREIVALHCDPVEGAPFWIERARDLDIDAARGLESWQDLDRFGWMDEGAMRARPIDDFIPAAVRREGEPLIFTESSGFLGAPKTAVFTPEEFDAAFVAPFAQAAGAAGFGGPGRWLYLGPSGPHPIGLAARRLARLGGGDEPFTIDFDPRWFNRLAAGSFSRERYLEHLVDQARAILMREPIAVVFATPALLERLAAAVPEPVRASIRGVHYGGQSLDPDRAARLIAAFPAAVHLAGYGNSLFGVCMELKSESEPAPRYFPHGDRLRLRVVEPGADGARPPSECRWLHPGERGRVVMDRFDRSMMILNMLERDEADRIEPGEFERTLGFTGGGAGRPGPARALAAQPPEGIY